MDDGFVNQCVLAALDNLGKSELALKHMTRRAAELSGELGHFEFENAREFLDLFENFLQSHANVCVTEDLKRVLELQPICKAGGAERLVGLSRIMQLSDDELTRRNQAHDSSPDGMSETVESRADIAGQLTYRCSCGKEYRVRAHYAGQSVICKRCGDKGKVPQAANTLPPADEIPERTLASASDTTADATEIIKDELGRLFDEIREVYETHRKGRARAREALDSGATSKLASALLWMVKAVSDLKLYAEKGDRHDVEVMFVKTFARIDAIFKERQIPPDVLIESLLAALKSNYEADDGLKIGQDYGQRLFALLLGQYGDLRVVKMLFKGVVEIPSKNPLPTFSAENSKGEYVIRQTFADALGEVVGRHESEIDDESLRRLARLDYEHKTVSRPIEIHDVVAGHDIWFEGVDISIVKSIARLELRRRGRSTESIAITCKCGKRFRVDSQYLGKSANCPNCGDQIAIG